MGVRNNTHQQTRWVCGCVQHSRIQCYMKGQKVYLLQQSQNLGESHPVPTQTLPTYENVNCKRQNHRWRHLHVALRTRDGTSTRGSNELYCPRGTLPIHPSGSWTWASKHGHKYYNYHIIMWADLRKGVTCSRKSFLSYVHCKILLNKVSTLNFEVVKMDILGPRYGRLKLWTFEVYKKLMYRHT